MADNRQIDSLNITSMALPYIPNLGQLAEKHCFVRGQNVYVPWGGTLDKRPGTSKITSTGAGTLVADRLWVYETLEASPKVYYIASMKNGSIWQLYYQRADTADTWHLCGERRGSNHSQFPHEGIVKRGFMYIKAFPNSTDDPSKLGCIRLDGTGGSMTTHDWGALGPSSPVALSSPGGWSASAHSVTVNSGWAYVYTYQMVSGHETNHSPLQTNPDSSPSATGAFTNKRPSMTVTGLADTTEYPFINMYRTTDGGGTFFFLKQIANTGAGSITFVDQYLASGSGNADPLPDTQLNTFIVAPANNANSPPPAVAPPLVTGTDNIQRCSRIIEYSNRIWYAINNFVFYGSLEELSVGVPEEAWPSGVLQPNFFEMPRTVTQMLSTPNGVLVPMRRGTIRINGSTKSTFNPRNFLGSVGGAANFQNRAAVEAGENVAWITEDYRLAVVNGDSYAILTDPIANGSDGFAADLAVPGVTAGIAFWTQTDKEYLIVGIFDPTIANCHMHVYDLARARKSGDDFWFPPWNISGMTAMVAGQTSVSDTENKLILYRTDNTNTVLCKLDTSIGSDVNPTTLAAGGYGWSATIALLPAPSGNHINQLREPYLSPVFASAQFERTLYGGDSDPTAFLYVDDFFTTPQTMDLPGDAPARRAQSTGYKTIVENNIRTVGKHVAFSLSSGSSPTSPTATTYQAQIHQVILSWIPDQGA